MSTALIVLLGTLFGGAGLKIIELLWTRFNEGRLERREAEKRYEVRAQELQDAQLAGLRDTLKTSQEELNAAEEEIVKWRESYFDVRKELLEQLSELQAALLRIKELENELARAKSRNTTS